MSGSDKHHICMKGTDINGLSPSYKNELAMIEEYYQEKIKVSDIVTSLGRLKQTIYVLKK